MVWSSILKDLVIDFIYGLNNKHDFCDLKVITEEPDYTHSQKKHDLFPLFDAIRNNRLREIMDGALNPFSGIAVDFSVHSCHIQFAGSDCHPVPNRQGIEFVF